MLAALEHPFPAQSATVLGGFIQIVHDGFGHWLTISTIEATSSTEVFIYDSMYASISTNVKQQIAAIMARPEEKITVKMMDAQKQAGGSDCGLFAIAFTTALIDGKQPDSIRGGSRICNRRGARARNFLRPHPLNYRLTRVNTW